MKKIIVLTSQGKCEYKILYTYCVLIHSNRSFILATLNLLALEIILCRQVDGFMNARQSWLCFSSHSVRLSREVLGRSKVLHIEGKA